MNRQSRQTLRELDALQYLSGLSYGAELWKLYTLIVRSRD